MRERELHQQILEQYRVLLGYCRSMSRSELGSIRKAFEIILDKHGASIRPTGEYYFVHAISVAGVVAHELDLGPTSVIATLLKDILYDNRMSLNAVEEAFGKDVAIIVQGLTKISRVKTDKTSLQSENFIKLMLTLADDVRVILIKVAERLQVMRIMDKHPTENRIKSAQVAAQLYAPIAHRLGLYSVKTELEELAMKYMYTEIYRSIARKLKETRASRNAFIKAFIQPVQAKIEAAGLQVELKGRPKSIYSIWNKMKKQNVEFDQVYDLFAIRIILDSAPEQEKADCWKVYSIVTDMYKPNPKRLRDWISSPKASGYESLHTTLLAADGSWVEVQIRTRRMDEVAEKGLAAHWKYKGASSEQETEAWLQNIRNLLESPQKAGFENIDQSKMELYSDNIFVFTPEGDLKRLPQAATVLDFAYQVHSRVGSGCTGARVNGKIVPIRHVLNNGDEVEVITAKNQKPKSDWLQFVQSARTKAKIRKALREAESQMAPAGKEMLMRKLSQLKISFGDDVVSGLMDHFKRKTALDLYQAIGSGELDIVEVKDWLKSPETTKPLSTPPVLPEPEQKMPTADSNTLMINNNADLTDYVMAKCCNPVFGDDIFGFVTVGRGIKIHRSNCPNAAQMREKFAYRIIPARWVQAGESVSQVAQLRIVGRDELGILNTISQVIANDMKVNVRGLSFDSKHKKFDGTVKVSINNVNHLEALIRKLAKIKGVEKVTRIN